jgi:hypothetical protein
MKIIAKGSIPTPPPNWWTLQTLKCENCHTALQLDDTDKPSFGQERRPGGKRWVAIECPVCGRRIKHIEVAMRGTSPENVPVLVRKPAPYDSDS